MIIGVDASLGRSGHGSSKGQPGAWFCPCSLEGLRHDLRDMRLRGRTVMDADLSQLELLHDFGGSGPTLHLALSLIHI